MLIKSDPVRVQMHPLTGIEGEGFAMNLVRFTRLLAGRRVRGESL